MLDLNYLKLFSGRPPGPEMENAVNRESYSLAAGLALGLVMLEVTVVTMCFQMVTSEIRELFHACFVQMLIIS